MELDIIKEINYQRYILDKHDKLDNESRLGILTMTDIYPDFNWQTYKELNPYLYLIGLKTEEDYIHNYLLEGRYKGRIYKHEQKRDFSFHVLLATIGKKSIFSMIEMLKKQLHKIDYLTIIFDGIGNTNNIEEIRNYITDFQCKVNVIIQEENLGFWGHGIRNKYKDLEGDFCYHIDDDDVLFDNSFDDIRKHCNDLNMIYIFKIMLENNSIIWKKKEFIYSKISTQSCVIPIHINKEGYWVLKYGGDYDHHLQLARKYNVLFIDKLIYRKVG